MDISKLLAVWFSNTYVQFLLDYATTSFKMTLAVILIFWAVLYLKSDKCMMTALLNRC